MPELVTIAEFNETAQAHLAKAMLEGSGIKCFLINEHLSQMNWMYGLAAGIRLQVMDDDAQEAIDILQSQIFGRSKDAAPDTDSYPCPSCESTDTRQTSLGKFFLALSGLFGLPIPVKLQGYKCKKCGRTWR